MYSEWESLAEVVQSEAIPNNVLSSFPSMVGKDVVLAVLRSLVVEPFTSQSKTAVPSPLSTPEQVHWTMQVIGHGLTLPLNEQALIASCIDIYDSWLSSLHTKKKSIPAPVLDDPDHYAQIIFEQFSQLFMPRRQDAHSGPSLGGSGSLHLSTNSHNHAVLCNRVLQVTHQIIRNANTKFSRETWQALFKYLLKVLDVLLSPPPEPTSLGVTLCSLLIHVLFEAWLCACIACFPSPSLWKTLRELFCNWRHHHYVVEQWNKVTYSLTLRVIKHLYGPRYLASIESSLPKQDKDFQVILDEMPKDVLVQSWFRMLHTIGNPVEVSYQSRIIKSPAFQKAIEEFESSKHRHKHHPSSPVESCLKELPKIFEEAMSGVASLVYLFLAQDLPGREATGVESVDAAQGSPSVHKRKETHEQKSGQGPAGTAATKSNKSKWYVPAVSPGLPTITASQGHTSTSSPMSIPMFGEVGKPKGNTLLHLFAEEKESKRHSKMASTAAGDKSNSAHSKSHDLVDVAVYEEGRAEAVGALCSIFSSQRCGEPFLPIYLARFYHSLAVGLQYNKKFCRGEMLTKIILHSHGLLRKDLRGIHIIVPHFITALELILPQHNVQFKCSVDTGDLRHSSIDLLLSMLSLPLHFLYQTLPDLTEVIPDLSSPPVGMATRPDSIPILPPQDSQATPDSTDGPSFTFLSLKDRLLHLLFAAIDSERDPLNIQMLLHGLMAVIQDIVCYENGVAKMLSEESAEDAEVSAITSRHPPLGPTRSNASIHSQATHVPTVFSTSTLFKQAIASGNYCLVEWGESNVQVALAALELISGLAELQIEDINHIDCQHAVLLVCKFIQYQAMKDRPQHNKDLHTSIVAALRTLLMWINAHPYLLGNKESLTAVMEVIELGISGSVSAGTNGETVYKGDKQLKPVSGRVKEMAEYMLSCVMEKTGAFPSSCGAEASSSLLAEEDILAKLPSDTKDGAKFRYFVMDNSVILGLLEESFAEKESSSLPTVTAVIRSLTGRHVWSMQLRHNPRSEQVSTEHMYSMPRPVPVTPAPIPHSELERRPWPEEVDLEPVIKVDQSIPALEDVLDEDTLPVHNTMAQITSQQVDREVKVHSETRTLLDGMPFPDAKVALEPPEVKNSFNTARLFLSHLGMLGIESVKEHPVARYPSLMMLESGANFQNALCSLDRLPSRYCNTVFMIYLKDGLSKPEDILLTQKTLMDKPAEYIEFLHGLGWIVDPVSHPGFTGRIRQTKSDDLARPIGLSAQIPLRPFPYYADAISEVAFITPTLKPSSSDSATSVRSTESSDSGQDTSSLSSQTLQQGGDIHSISSMQPLLLKDTQGSGVSESTVLAESSKASSSGAASGTRRLSSRVDLVTTLDTPRSRRGAVPQDCAAIVVWLEKFEDHLNFPLETLSGMLHGGSFAAPGSHKMNLSTKKALPVVFIHMLSSGLFQIVTKNSSSRPDSMAGPLIDGMVVSRRSLSMLVRRTTMNMCHRHRMENEGYCPPHVKRKRKIEEISANFGLQIPVAEFYHRLFSQREFSKRT